MGSLDGLRPRDTFMTGDQKGFLFMCTGTAEISPLSDTMEDLGVQHHFDLIRPNRLDLNFHQLHVFRFYGRI
jgi:hypothetical protein